MKELDRDGFLNLMTRIEVDTKRKYTINHQRFIHGEKDTVFLTNSDVVALPLEGNSLTKSYVIWLYYRFEDGRIIEFCRIGDHLGWMLDNQVSALKRIVEEAEGGRNEKQIKGYIQQLIDAGYLENN